MARAKGLLDLPRELRDEIYQHLVAKPTNTITMLENHACFDNEISAAQPAVCRVSKQIRAESLPGFYKSNVFLAELSNSLDLHIAQQWLTAIGDLNVGCLRRLAVCGWTKVVVRGKLCRLWIRLVFNLKDGSLAVEGNEAKTDAHHSVFKDLQPIEDHYRHMLGTLGGDGNRLDAASLGRLMEGFHALCADYCTDRAMDVDGECTKCDGGDGSEDVGRNST